MTRWFIGCGVLALTLGVLSVPAPAKAAGCTKLSRLVGWSELSRLTQLGCDLSDQVLDLGDGVRLEIPDRGTMTGTYLLFAGDGATRLPESVTAWRTTSGQLGVWDSTGRVSGSSAAVREGRALAATQSGTASATQSWCGTANNYQLTGRRWSGAQLRWYYNGAGFGGEGSRSIIRDGFNAMTADSSRCGSGANRSSAPYVGLTSRAPGARDGYNVVSFSDLPGDVLAQTTWWWERDDGLTVEADVAFDRSNRRWFISSSTQGCSKAYDMLAVAVHEAGHAFGLAHVNGVEVMKASLSECEMPREKRRGDLDGMRKLYP